MIDNQYYKRATLLTIALYFCIFIVLFVSVHFESKARPTPLTSGNAPPEPKVIEAVAVNAQVIRDQVKEIKAEREAEQQAKIKAAAEKARQIKMQKMAEEAKALQILQQKKMAEQKKIEAALAQKRQAQLKKAQAVLEQKRQEEAKAAAEKIAKMKAQKEQLQKKLVKVQQKTAATTTKTTPNPKPVKKTSAKNDQDSLQSQIASEEKNIQAARSQQIQSEVDKYKALILNAIGQKWIMPAKFDKNATCEFLINLAPGGMVLNVKLLHSSGNPALDNSVVTAIWQSSPLPVPTEADAFMQFRELDLTVKPQGLLGGQ